MKLSINQKNQKSQLVAEVVAGVTITLIIKNRGTITDNLKPIVAEDKQEMIFIFRSVEAIIAEKNQLICI